MGSGVRRGVGRRQDAKMKYFRQTEERHATDFSRICTLGVYSVRAKVPQARREKKNASRQTKLLFVPEACEVPPARARSIIVIPP